MEPCDDCPIISASGENRPNETKEMAFDGDSATKWLTFADTGWIQYDYPGTTAMVIDEYTITSANDFPERDPRDWQLKASNDGTNWTTLDSRNAETFSARYQTRSFTFANSTAYQIYRLDIGSNLDAAAANSTQLAEIELLKSVGAADSDGDGIQDAADNCPNHANADQADTDGDGNLVLYTAANAPVWASNTVGSGATELRLNDDGDIVDDDRQAQWDMAAEAWNQLIDNNVPCVPNQGNHDSISSLNETFPLSKFRDKPWWGGDSGGIENSYQLFTIYNEDYLFLNVEDVPDSSAYDWARNVLSDYPDRKVILATHNGWSNHGVENNLIKNYDNIVMMNSGHDCAREDYWVVNNSHNFLTDYQCDSQEVMLLRFYKFKSLEDEVEYYTYSPITSQFERDNSSQGSFSLVQADGSGSIDYCPNDPNKTEPGECGCGVSEGSCGITDADGDGVQDSVDNCPNNADTDDDNDGMPDDWELTYGLNPLEDGADSDPDGDDVSNINEFNLGTAPNFW